ncbi:MAG: Pr6Pr family membrane protein [Clostridiales Family XIII bacterium]|nr:Pr6Pr family membrane protein [Clostridiales Family XIII bacterium]
MKNNRIFALCYRLAAFLLCLAGVLHTLGVFDGRFQWKMMLYYTIESNILIVLMFGFLSAKTARDLRKGGVAGASSYHERLTAIAMLSITVTLLLFWALLAPSMPGPGLLSYVNLQIHAFTPLLMIVDFFLFATPGKMKKQDPWLFALVPLTYFIQSTVLGFSGFRYSVQGEAGSRFPYFFVDFDLLKGKVFLYVFFIAVFFVGLAYLLLWYDGKRGRKWRRAQAER